MAYRAPRNTRAVAHSSPADLRSRLLEQVLFLEHEAIQSAVPFVDAARQAEAGHLEFRDHHVWGDAMSSAVGGNALYAEERRQKPSRREVHDGQTTTRGKCVVKAGIGLHGPGDMMVDASHQNRITAVVLETGVDLTRFDHGKMLKPGAGSRRLNLLATLAVNLRRKHVTSRSDEPSQLQGVLSLPGPHVRNATALANAEQDGKLGGLAPDARGADARNEQPATSQGSDRDGADDRPP